MGLTQEQFAERLHVTPLTVLRWESGKSRPRPLALARLREVEIEAQEAAAQSAQSPNRRAVPAPGAPPLDFAGDPEAVSAVAEAYRLTFGHQFNPAFASEIARIDPLPHQRIAVYERMLPQDPLRFLLADDAGAGKTIMTGLVVREMLSRGRAKRVLIVPPAGLVGNWERELRTLFRLSFRIVSGAEARQDRGFSGPDSDLVIVSLDTLAHPSVFARLRETSIPYDLVVFDEAHKLGANTDNRHRTHKTRRYRLAEAIVGCGESAGAYAGLPWSARHLVLLTATPHMGKDSPYYHLWRLLDPHAFATAEACRRLANSVRARHFIRRTKEEMVTLAGAPLYRQRRCATFSYALTQEVDGEQTLYDSTTEYLTDTYGRAVRNRAAAKLVRGVFQRRMASSTWALLCSFERRIDKLRRIADDIEGGRINLRDTQRLNSRYVDDHFETHAADDEGDREASEDFEDAVLGAVVAVALEDLHAEIQTLEDLTTRAQAIVDSGNESKFEKLREVLDDPRYLDEKWLIFTEHRDTMEYLVRRLEGLGHAGRIARLHGGMAWAERELQVGHFRRKTGARFLVATDAAGEGINLQFCAVMANYDIPWNPARLEQRMGRIHRYGQTRDVTIVNLVSGSTREGRVLEVLLKKLDAIREELSSDKVFDVVGRLFEDTSLKDYMVASLTDDGEAHAITTIGETFSTERVRHLHEAQEQTYGRSDDVATRLSGLQADMERERYLQLLPGYVWRFAEKSAQLLDLDLRGELGDNFALVPRRPGALDGLLPALQTYEPELRERLRIHRPNTVADGIWLHPGEPVFDALVQEVLTRFGRDALRGGIFVDPLAKSPYLYHLAVVSAELEADFSPDGTSPRTQPLERRLAAIRQEESGKMDTADIEPLLLLRGDPDTPPGAVPLASRGVGMRAQATAHLQRWARRHLSEEWQNAMRRELPERLRRLAAGFDLRSAELASQRARLTRVANRTVDAERQLDAIKQEQRTLAKERATIMEAAEAAPSGVRPAQVEFVAHALAVPPAGADANSSERLRHEETVEAIAVRIASAWETDRHADVVDVSKPSLARSAGLADHPGFDLLATSPDGHRRSIEVKGRSGRDPIQVEINEWKQACNLGDRYWLYVVFDCATPRPMLVRVQNPFAKLLATMRHTAAFVIPAQAVLDARTA